MVKDILGALAVQGELFAPFQYRLVIVIELIFSFAQDRHVFIDAGHQHKTAPDGDGNPQRSHRQHFAGEPGEIGRRAEGQNDPLHQLRQTNECDSNGANVAGQPRQQGGAAELLDALDLSVQDPLDKLAAQAKNEMVAERSQCQLGAERNRHQQKQQAEKLRQYGERGVDHFNQPHVNKRDQANTQCGAGQA